MPHDYALEKLYMASLSLAAATGDIKERLERAATGLTVVEIDKNALLPKLQDEFDSIMGDVSRTPAQSASEGSIRATIREMTDEEAYNLAGRIFHLYIHLLHGSAL